MDIPVNNNECVVTSCLGDMQMTSNRPHGYSCTQSNGRTCNGSGSCLLTFNVSRVGAGTAVLANTATAVFLDEYSIAGGTPLTTVALPTAPEASPSTNLAFTLSGTANSQGNLSLSADGKYVVLAGFNRNTGVAGNVGNSLAMDANRIAARVDAAGKVNTTTLFGNTAFSGDNIRGAASTDGSSFWLTGASSVAGAGGVWYAALGATSGTQITATPANTRCALVRGGQLYGSGNSTGFNSVFTVGNGLPTSGPQTANRLQNMPDAGAPFSMAFFTVNGVETLYVADDATATRGIQKWKKDGTTGDWSLDTTFTVGTAGFHGVTGVQNGSTVTLITTTEEGNTVQNRVLIFVDTGIGAPTVTPLVTAPTNTRFRGVALSPHL